MNSLSLKLSLVALVVGSFGCSNQFRTGPVDDGAHIVSELNSLTATNSSNEIAQISQLAQSGAALYYADSPTYGPVMSVLSFPFSDSFNFLGRSDLRLGMIEQVKVIFVDAHTAQGRQAGLLLSIKEFGKNAEVRGFIGSAMIDNDEYVAVLELGGGNKLVLATLYVDDDGELENIVRMEAFLADSAGNETFIGQFSTLVGYQL